tara:strand:- start:55 stop:1158 length:1104 start_codon:yes stop_codon:yes gene_type:complete
MKKEDYIPVKWALSPSCTFSKGQEKLYSFCYKKDLKILQEGGEVIVKIGRTISVANRLQSFNNSSPEEVHELFQIKFWEIKSEHEKPLVLDLEDFLKLLFHNDPRVKHIKGEWYKVSLGVLKFYFDCLEHLPDFIKCGKWPTFYSKLHLDPNNLIQKLNEYELNQEKVITRVEEQITKIEKECAKLGPFVEEMENTCEEKRKFLKKFSEETLAVRAFSKQLKEKHPDSGRLEDRAFTGYDSLFHIAHEIRMLMMYGSDYHGDYSDNAYEDYEHYFTQSLECVKKLPYNFEEDKDAEPQGDKNYHQKATFAKYSINEVREKIYKSLTKKNWLVEIKKDQPLHTLNRDGRTQKWIIKQEETRDNENFKE